MKTIVMAGGLLASAALLTGCGLQNLTTAANQESVSYQVTDKVAKLRLSSGSGNTVISETGGNAIKVVETLKWNAKKPTTSHKVEGDALAMSYDCSAAMDNCGVDYKIEIPKGLPIEVETGSGDVELKALTGPIVASVGSGDLVGLNLAGKQVVVDTGSGDTKLKYAAAPDDVKLTTGSGNTTVELPGGPYAIKAATDSGDATISVKHDPAATRKITVQAGSGDVSVLPA